MKKDIDKIDKNFKVETNMEAVIRAFSRVDSIVIT